MDEAFQGLRKCLCSRVVLNVPCAKDYFVLYTDASGGRVGACLHVRREEQELPMAFFSTQLRSAEKSYRSSCLQSLLSSRLLNKCLKRFALKLQDRELNIRYRPGKTNGNADKLSRQDWDEDGLDSESEVVLGYQTSPTGKVLAGEDVGPPSCERKKIHEK